MLVLHHRHPEPSEIAGVDENRRGVGADHTAHDVLAEQIFIANQRPQTLAGHGKRPLMLPAHLVFHRNAHQPNEPVKPGRHKLAERQ